MNPNTILNNLSWIDSVAGGVWLILSGLLVGILIMIYNRLGISNRYFGAGVLLLMAIWLYPLYTSFYSQLIIGEIGNIATLIATVGFIKLLRKFSVPTSRLLIPQVIWLSMATFYVGLMLVAG